MSGIWWTKMEHKEDFCEHFCEMSDKEIVADIRKSINSFLKQRADGADFGAKMVKKALDRITSKHDSAVANGSLGGLATAAKNKSPQDAPNGNAGVDMSDTGNGAASKSPTSCDTLTADGDTREDSQAKPDGSAITRNETRAHDALEPSANHYGPRQAEARESRRTGADSLRSDCHSAPVRLPDFVEFTRFIDAQGLDYTDAREWWEMTMVDRDGKDRDGKPIRNWKITCRRFCEAKAKKRKTAK